MAVLRLLALLVMVPVLAGCAADPASIEAPVAATPTEPSDLLTVATDGTLALGNCSDTGNACGLNVGTPLKPAGNIVHVPFDGSGGAYSTVSGTLTWTANSPLTERLALRVVLLGGCPNQCSTDEVVLETAGASPLTIEVPTLNVDEELTLGFTVLRAEFLDSGQRVSLLQDFHLEGSAQLA